MPHGLVTEIEENSQFNDVIGKAKEEGKAVVVDFSAVWCGPCGMIAPYFAELSEKHTNVVFIKVDVDKCEAVAAQCGISAMPTFQVWKNGEKVAELVGASKDKLKALVEDAAK